MAIAIHVAKIQLMHIGPDGTILDRNTSTINQMLQSSIEHRIVADDDIPNSLTNPTIENYLLAEANDDFVLHHMDQTFVITYEEA